ncbi:hypothetical protein HI914_06613 [Erysiphe necator]|nr:hypothetical protein HI914_06613 [Erysiphe necator]
MRHRVTTFFRANSNALGLHSKGSEVTRDLLSNTSTSKRADASPNTYISDCSEKNPAKMQDTHKWISIPSLHCSKSYSHKAHQTMILLDMEIESPPLVLYGLTTTSTGALLSGQLILEITHETTTVNSCSMSLVMDITRKRPFHSHCSNCERNRTELESWKFLNSPTKFRKGKHKLPFSWILPGNLTASSSGTLFSIEYKLHAVLALGGVEDIMFSKTLEVKRAIIPSEIPRNSIRIFPPTNLTANCGLPSILHPYGISMVSIIIDGCVRENAESKILRLWKLKRLHWYLNETQKIFSPGCGKHLAKQVKKIEGKGVSHTDVRVIGENCYRMGWKANYTKSPGRIEMEFPCAIRPGARPICDLKTQDGIEVSHSLIVQMIFVEETVSLIRSPIEATSTGSARVLRMNFNMTVTEHSGLGISWDEEQPPLYENVPASPPGYMFSFSNEENPIPNDDDIIRIDAQGTGLESSPKNSFDSHILVC